MGTGKRCLNCGKFFTAITEQYKYCSEKCGRQFRNRKKRKPTLGKKCLKCGRTFVTTKRIQKFCSMLCKNIFHKQGIIKIKRCLCCGREFECTNDSKFYCENSCYLKAKRIRDKKLYERRNK